MSKSKILLKQQTNVKVNIDAGTGQFLSKKYVVIHPKSTVTEIVKNEKYKSFTPIYHFNNF